MADNFDVLIRLARDVVQDNGYDYCGAAREAFENNQLLRFYFIDPGREPDGGDKGGIRLYSPNDGSLFHLTKPQEVILHMHWVPDEDEPPRFGIDIPVSALLDAE